MTQLLSPLVGSHFRPPAKAILAHLPDGASLVLDPEPSNPYDPSAVRVLVGVSEIPESEYPALEVELPEFGSSLEDLLKNGTLSGEDLDIFDEPMIFLGYIAASGGKPLEKVQAQRPNLVGNSEVLSMLVFSPATPAARLRFGPSGEPEVEVAEATEAEATQ